MPPSILAAHEAAHALVCHHLGVAFRTVSIQPTIETREIFDPSTKQYTTVDLPFAGGCDAGIPNKLEVIAAVPSPEADVLLTGLATAAAAGLAANGLLSAPPDSGSADANDLIALGYYLRVSPTARAYPAEVTAEGLRVSSDAIGQAVRGEEFRTWGNRIIDRARRILTTERDAWFALATALDTHGRLSIDEVRAILAPQ